jgi:REP element-mobilizing transposase RayT
MKPGLVEAILYNAAELGHYRLWAFVVMPNHVHLLLTPVAQPTITKSLKGITAKRANIMLADYHAGIDRTLVLARGELRSSGPE